MSDQPRPMLVGLGIGHAVRRPVLVLDRGGGVGAALFDLLLLLDQGAAGAAARERDIGEAATAEVEAGAHLGALHGGRDPVKTEAGGAAEEEALYSENRVSQ